MAYHPDRNRTFIANWGFPLSFIENGISKKHDGSKIGDRVYCVVTIWVIGSDCLVVIP